MQSRKAKESWAPIRSHRQPHEKQRERLAQRRQKKRLMILGLSVFGLLLVVALLVGATHLRVLRIAQTDIAGNVAISNELLGAHVDAYLALVSKGLIAKANAPLFPTEAFAQSVIGSFPRIKRADAEIEGFLHPVLHLTVRERDAYARWCRESDCFLVDEGGFVFAHDEGEERAITTDFAGTLTSDAVIGRVFAPEHFTQLKQLTVAFAQRGFVPRRAEFTADNAVVNFMLERGFVVRVPIDADAETIASTLDVSLASEALRGKSGLLEYVDMRFGNRIYYKFQGQPVPEREPALMDSVSE
ncbi:MAG: hypothetical protein KBE09_04270 [Candidatus Pacebacteria bacterium]|nr:hypothetical protein [Candidatus Paceibacterota bacterium]